MSISFQVIARTIAIRRSAPGSQEEFVLLPCAALLARLTQVSMFSDWKIGCLLLTGVEGGADGPAMPLRFKINVDIADSGFQTRVDSGVVARRLQ